MVDHWDRAWNAAEACANLVTTETPVRVLAAEYVRQLPRTTRDVLAEDQFASLVASIVRERTLRAERAAERPPRPLATEAKGDGLKHGSTNKRNGAVQTGCQCGPCVRTRESDALSDAVFSAKLRAIAADYREQCRMEWTAELLASTFALGDGTQIAWGDATIEHHQQRVDMFMANATANIEGAARHEEAIAALSASGAIRLYDIAEKLAA